MRALRPWFTLYPQVQHWQVMSPSRWVVKQVVGNTQMISAKATAIRAILQPTRRG